MKAYSVIITIIAVIAIAAAGLFYSQYAKLSKNVFSLEQDLGMAQTARDMADSTNASLKTGMQNIQQTNEALKAVLTSFTVAGTSKISAINTDEASTTLQQIDSITDSTDKTAAENNWNTFITSKKITDLLTLLNGLSNNLDKNITNALPK